MSGAEPWTGSNRPGPSPPSEALGSNPIDPVSIAASSERMSPNIFWVRITAKWQRAHRTQVCEQAEPLAEPEQALFRPRLRRVGGVPLGAADGGEQNGVRGAALREKLVGQRRPVRVDRGAAEQPLLERELTGGDG